MRAVLKFWSWEEHNRRGCQARCFDSHDDAKLHSGQMLKATGNSWTFSPEAVEHVTDGMRRA